MSANSDARKLLDLALQAGLEIRKTKHSGYAILSGGRVIARVHTGTDQRRHVVKKARRAILRAFEQ